MTVEKVREIIEHHIDTLNTTIFDQQQRIRQIYDAGMHANIDPYSSTISRCEQQRFVLMHLLDEISE